MTRPSKAVDQKAATLVMDIGNARIKWASVDKEQLISGGRASHVGALDMAIEHVAAELPANVARIVVANVAGTAIAERLVQLSRDRYGVIPEFVASTAELQGVQCAYEDPARLGVDRWVAVVKAHQLACAGDGPLPACVINAGTAMTLDAVDGAGRHLGGLIIPGPRIAAEALDRRTDGIGATAPANRAPKGLDLLGRSTDEAVGYGALLGPAAAFDRAIRSLTQALGVPPRVYVAGGDASLLAAWMETEIELRLDLVLEGLALVAMADDISGRCQPDRAVGRK